MDIIGNEFEGMENEQQESRYPFITKGTYKLEVRKLSAFNSKKSPGKRYVAGEFKVLESSGDEAIKPGEMTTHLISLGKFKTRANVQSLTAAVLNENPKTISGATAKELFTNPPESVKGIVVTARAFPIESGFVVVEYAPAT